ncbi:MAG: hypothetical protein SNJ84_09745 [Verrucomicrobiia bacterium]
MKVEASMDGKGMVFQFSCLIVTITGSELGKIFEAAANQTLSRVEGRRGGRGRAFVNEIRIKPRNESEE